MLSGSSVPSRLSSSRNMSKLKPSNILSRTFQFRDLTSALLHLSQKIDSPGIEVSELSMWLSSASPSQPGLEIDILLFFEPLRLGMALGPQRELGLVLPKCRAGIPWNDPRVMPSLPDKLQVGARPDTLYRVTR
jgi:hypothetical protein